MHLAQIVNHVNLGMTLPVSKRQDADFLQSKHILVIRKHVIINPITTKSSCI